MRRETALTPMLLCATVWTTGCKDEATRTCQSELTSAQEVVQCEGGNRSGVERSIAAVDRALELCRHG
ncbi:MAG: hypothetical protein QM756_32805 [Polyangiaceae bacterium]